MAHRGHEEFREELYGDHPHSYDHRDPNHVVLFVLIGTTVVILGIVALGIQFYYERFYENRTYEKVLSQENWNLQELRRNEARELQTYGYADASKGTVRIPIDRAMELLVKEAAENRLKYPTNPYPVKPVEQLQGSQPAVSQPGAAAAAAAQEQGATSSPNAKDPIR